MTILELKRKKISAISLGCDKNRVDLEKMLYNLKNFGFEIVEEDYCDVLIINTCAFIAPAIQEAINTIMEAISLKGKRIEKIIVTGCLKGRFGNDVVSLISEVDAFVDLKDNDKIVDIIAELYGVDIEYESKNGRVLTNLPHFAFLKIADGCDNGCAYCTIPRIRGRYKSVPMDELVAEAKELAKMGVKELILVAQDITRYGIDLYNHYKLVSLIKELSKIKNIKWIRLHYCYPEMVDKELLDEIKNNPKVCKYIDIPFQHIDDKILKDMNRRSGEEQIRNLVKLIKSEYPEIAIRTTFIVGFPGETKKQFNKLLDFLKETRLDNVGFFAFSKEEKTKAFFMKKQVCSLTKKRRLKKAQKIQEQIVNANAINKIGEICEIIVDFYDQDEGYYVCRTAQNSPDVDFFVLIKDSQKLNVGEMYTVKITDFMLNLFKGEII